jgi:hypothetical protein
MTIAAAIALIFMDVLAVSCGNFAADDDTGRGGKVNSLVTSM